MATRKADFDAEIEPQSKRFRRGSDTAGAHVTSPSLKSLNDDCLLVILSYLPIDDLNSVAICNQRCSKARAHESLNQTRKGTLIISEGTTLHSLAGAFSRNGWNNVFQGNRTHLEIVGLEWIGLDRFGERELGLAIGEVARVSLTGVTRLELKVSPTRQISYNVMQFLTLLVPNLKEVDFGDLSLIGGFDNAFETRWPKLAKVTWNRRGHVVWTDGYSKLFPSNKLTELYYDNACFRRLSDDEFASLASRDEFPNSYLLSWCRHVEKLSIKGATFWQTNSHDEAQTVPQDVLVKMVRLHPALRWLRSDLTEENIAMLKVERPDITFVSD